MFVIAVAVFAAVTPPFALVARTARADYYVLRQYPQLEVKAEACEAFLAGAERFVGVKVPHFSYFRVADEKEVEQYGGLKAGGTASSQPLQTVATSACNQHEIAHLVGFQLARPSKNGYDRFWHEGWAGWLSGDRGFFTRFDAQQEAKRRATGVPEGIAAFCQRKPSASEYTFEYRLAAAFTHFLVKKYGQDKYLTFFRRLGVEREKDEAAGVTTPGFDERAFQAVYGQTIADASRHWLD